MEKEMMKKEEVKAIPAGKATFLTNISGGAMCSMSDDAQFGPVTSN